MKRSHTLRSAARLMILTLLVTPVIAIAGSQMASAAAITYTVNTTSDASDAAQGNGVCATAAGECSLRAAIQEGKSYVNSQITVNFDIPGNGPHVINISTALPILDRQSTSFFIDGYSEPGASPNTNPLASNAVLKIQIRGTGDNGSFVSWYISGRNNTIRGLSMTRAFKKIVMYGANANNNTVTGSWIGTDPAGTSGASSRTTYANGIELNKGAHHNYIGEPTLAGRMVISGNAGHGLAIYDPNTNYNVVRNTIVGLRPDGTGKIPNKVEGLDINRDSSYNVFGGFGQYERNVVSGNDTGGVEISHNLGTIGNQVLGNFAGTTLDGNSVTSWTRNGSHGIVVEDGASETIVDGNVVGGNAAGIELKANGSGREVIGNIVRNNFVGISPTGANIANTGIGIHIEDRAINNRIENNTIANNGGNAIQFDSNWGTATGNTFTRNSIYDNGGRGIDLSPIGSVNQNDVGDADVGPNTLRNFPEFTRTDSVAVEGNACANCKVEVFTTTNPLSGNGQGRAFVGEATANGAGHWSLNVNGLLDPGQRITSTATDLAGNTSEFSANAAIVGVAPVADFSSSCDTVNCTFEAAATDADGTIVNYAWNFGDGNVGNGASPSHTYGDGGIFDVQLTVTDNDGLTGTITKPVQVFLVTPNNPPTASFTMSCDGQVCTADGTDSSDGDGTVDDFSWDFGDGNTGTGVTSSHDYANAGIYDVTLTVTDDDNDTDAITHAISVDPSFEVPFTNDTFSRTVASGLGSADTGGAYTYPSGQGPSFSVDGSVGKLAVPTAGASRQAWLAGVSATDVEANYKVSLNGLPTGGSFGATSSVLLRRVAANTEYRLRLRVAPDGGVWIAAAKATGTNTDVVIGAETRVTGLVYTPGLQVQVRAQVFGSSPTTIRIKAWDASGSEPSSWTVVRTDSQAALQGAGGVGLFGYVSGSVTNPPALLSFDDFVVTERGL